ncbi:MAG: glycyl-radical enzyme activating protein [Spirochaetales bacterium]|nr:glycyl-radical enzyme activating protein [Spirochaetales bacterium]
MHTTEERTGMVFNIQRFSVHDGPGIRTTVFMKGCNLHCFWCHNPESISPVQEVQLFPDKCIGCGNCFEVCPVHAHRMEEDHRVLDRELCERCGKCVDECYAGALKMAGELRTVSDVMSVVERDRAFYETSEGGVTYSGGEPLLSVPFLAELLRSSKERSIHTAVDTALNVSWSSIEKIIPLADLFLVDFKHIDSRAHREAVGVDNSRILENLEKLARHHEHLWVRIPVIPGVNANPDVLARMAEFLTRLERLERLELLAFHGLADAKYESLGQVSSASDLPTPSDEDLANFRQIFLNYDLPVK